MENTSIKEYEIIIGYDSAKDKHNANSGEKHLTYRVRNTTAEQCLLDAAYHILNLEKQGAEINFVNMEFVYGYEE